MARNPEIRLLVSVERDRFGGGYYHPIARPVRIDVDDGCERIRNVNESYDSPANERGLADLQIRAQGHADHQDGELYGWQTEYRDVFSVDLERAKRMAATLGKVERGLDRLNRELGYVDNFPAYLARVAKVLGVSSFGFKVDGSDSSYDSNTYEWKDASWLATYIARELKRTLEPAR